MTESKNPRLSEEQVRRAFDGAFEYVVSNCEMGLDYSRLTANLNAELETTPAPVEKCGEPAAAPESQPVSAPVSDPSVHVTGSCSCLCGYRVSPTGLRTDIVCQCCDRHTCLVHYPNRREAAETKEWVTAEDIRTVSSGVCEGFCGDAAKDLSEILAPRIEAHIAAAYKKEETCGTAKNVRISTSEDSTANHASNSDFLMPDPEWNGLKKETQEKVRKWFDLAAKYLQAILDEPERIELAEVRAALKEAEWWCRNLHREWDEWYPGHRNLDNSECLWCKRFNELQAREAELLARGGAKP